MQGNGGSGPIPERDPAELDNDDHRVAGPVSDAVHQPERRRSVKATLSALSGRAPAKTLLWQLVREQRWWLRAAIGVSAIGFLAQIALGQAAVAVVDKGVKDPTEQLGPLVIRMGILGVIHVTVAISAVLMMTRVRWTIEYRVRTALHRRLVANAVGDEDSSTGQVVTRAVADLGQLNNVVYLVPILVGSVPAVLAGMVYLGYLNFPLMLITFSSLPVNLWIVLRLRPRIRALSWLQLQETAEVTRAIDEPIRGIRVVKLFGREQSVIASVREAARNAYRFALTRVKVLAKYHVVLRCIPAVTQAALLLLGARAIEGGSLTTGQFLVFFVGSGQVVFFAQSFTSLLDGWSFAKTGSSRIGQLIDPEGVGVGDQMVGDDAREPTTLDAFGEPRIGWGCAGLVLGGPKQRTEPISFSVSPGEAVLVRSSKFLSPRAIADTLVGELAPLSGTVWLEDTDLHVLPTSGARTQLRVLDSEPYLFARTVRENLLLGARASLTESHEPDAGALRPPIEGRIQQALRTSRADEVVATLDGGLDEVLGDRAMNLSGGQRQRLALAQALLAEPRVLVLVEALSGVHGPMERDIIAAIQADYPFTAVLYLSTRPSAEVATGRTVTIGMHRSESTGDNPTQAPSRAPGSGTGADGNGKQPSGLAGAEPPSNAGRGAPPEAAALLERGDMTEAPRCSPDSEAVDIQPTVRNLASPFKRFLVALSAVAITISVIDLAPQYLFGAANNAVDAGRSETDRYALALVAFAVVAALAHWWFDVNAARLSNGMLYLLRTRLIRRLSRLGLAYYDRELPGYVATRVLHDLEEITGFARAVATRLVVVGLSLVAAVIAMALVGAQIVLMVLAIVASAIVLTAIEVPIARRAYLRQRAALGDVIARLEEDYNGRAAIDAAAAADEAVDSFDELAAKLRRAERWSALVGGFYSMAIQWIAEIGGALIMWRSGMLVLGGLLSLGSMLTLRLYLHKALQPVMELGNLVQQYLRARVSFDRLRQPYEAAILPVDRDDARKCERLEGDIVLDQLSFHYPETEREILTDISLRLPGDHTIAVVGPTGAGKSTIAKLITRVYDPDRGAVMVGHDDLREFTTASLRYRIGVVPQEPFLFAGTVAGNVAYGKPDASRAEIERSIEAVGATGGLRGLDGGLDTVVLEEGINLTPQQRQLVALARAWMMHPDILVLDEATSALDEQTELRVLESLKEREGTTIFVTHREQVAAAADLRLIVDGRPELEVTSDPLPA